MGSAAGATCRPISIRWADCVRRPPRTRGPGRRRGRSLAPHLLRVDRRRVHAHAGPERAPVAERMEAAPARSDRRRILARLAERRALRAASSTRATSAPSATRSKAPRRSCRCSTRCSRPRCSGGVEVAFIAMSHRGRLNVHDPRRGTRAGELFAGFEDVDPRSVLGSGDVKYHLGATGEYVAAPAGAYSHAPRLESEPPRGGRSGADGPRARAKQAARRGRRGAVLPIVVHGDAAFAGQGIAAETLNLRIWPAIGRRHASTSSSTTCIGFTTEPRALHSSRFATDVGEAARRFPILHVNGEDPDAVVRVGAHRARVSAPTFASDVVVDLIGYRRYGHSEVDDPTTTQPLLYRKIEARPCSGRATPRASARIGRDCSAAGGGITASSKPSRKQARADEEEAGPAAAAADYWTPTRAAGTTAPIRGRHRRPAQDGSPRSATRWRVCRRVRTSTRRS